MFAGSTLFLDAGIQRDFWPGGSWPLVDLESAAHVQDLCELARALGLRQGGVLCRHAAAVPGAPVHCVRGDPGGARIAGLEPALPVRIVEPANARERLDRAHALYVASGCALSVDASPAGCAAFDHLTAGVRDAVVFGAGLELGIAHVVEALLRRRVHTHRVVDAAPAADAVRAQEVIAGWKRRLVDVTTAATIVRLLRGA